MVLPIEQQKSCFSLSHVMLLMISIHYRQMGVSINGGTPIAGWFIRENPSLTWMRTGGSPMTQETSICFMDKSCDKCPFLMDIYHTLFKCYLPANHTAAIHDGARDAKILTPSLKLV